MCGYLRRLALRSRDDSGQTLVLIALGMLMLIGLLGLAIDVGQLRYARRQMQTQADAVALAAALELATCNGVNACGAMRAAAQDSLLENGVATYSYAEACAITASPAPNLTRLEINNPPCALAEEDNHHGNIAYVEIILSRNQQTSFASVLGFTAVPIVVRAEAGTAAATPSSDGAQTSAVVLVQ